MPAMKVDYAVRETVTNMRRNVFMAVAAVMVVSVSLVLTGGVYLVIRSINRFVDLNTHKVEVGVFLSKSVTPDQRDSIQRDLLAMTEVRSVIFESKQEAYERFKVLFADAPDIVQNVTPDVLPESFRVKLKDPKNFEIVRDRLAGRPGIEEIQDQRRFLKVFLEVTSAIRGIGIFLIVIFVVAAFALIATTIRMAIYARRREIAIMKLVGATNWFVRVPFLLEGVVQGLAGAFVATGFLFVFRLLMAKLFGIFRFLNLSVSIADVVILSFWLALLGMIVGAMGSFLGLRRFLEV